MSDTIRAILEEHASVAVVGLSTSPHKAAHTVPAALQRAGFTILPVHPTAHELLGERAYPSLADAPRGFEVVTVFRPAPEAPAIARQAVAAGAKALWLQLGIRSAEARAMAEEAGLLYVEDACIEVERARLGVVKTGAASTAPPREASSPETERKAL